MALRSTEVCGRGMKMTERHGCVSVALELKNGKSEGLGLHFSSAIFGLCDLGKLLHLSETQLFHPPVVAEMHEMTMLVKGLLYSSCSITAFLTSDLCCCFKVRSEVTLPRLKMVFLT